MGRNCIHINRLNYCLAFYEHRLSTSSQQEWLLAHYDLTHFYEEHEEKDHLSIGKRVNAIVSHLKHLKQLKFKTDRLLGGKISEWIRGLSNQSLEILELKCSPEIFETR